jgi:hypothetical protein
MSKKKRSVFWVVSTHVITTGFVMPAIAGMFSAPLVEMYPSTGVGFLLGLGCQALGYIAGVYYSLSYIRKAALIEQPMACVKPSIITFVVLSVFGFAVNVALLFGNRLRGTNAIIGIVGLVVFYVVISLAFAKITQRGFRMIAPYQEETKEVVS